MSVQVQFLPDDLVLIAVSRAQYPLVFYGIVRLVLRTWKLKPGTFVAGAADNLQQRSTEYAEDDDRDSLDGFINISFTPNECSLIIPRELLEPVFGDTLSEVPGTEVFPESYTAIGVDGQDGEGSTHRILQLSAPLATAGIPIFFVSTYFIDYVLIPTSARSAVEQLLVKEHFEYSKAEDAYIYVGNDEESAPSDFRDDKGDASGSDGRNLTSPLFAANPQESNCLWNADEPKPLLDTAHRLVLTGVRQNYEPCELGLALITTLVSPPAYFSLIIRASEMSFLVDEQTVQGWPAAALLGSRTDFMTPVLLDLSRTPLDVVGVVAGVSSRLLGENVFMSYVSTAHSSVVLVDEGQEDKVRAALGLI